MLLRRFALLLILAGLLGCGSSDNSVQPVVEPPSIQNLKINPEVICVGAGAEITFTIADSHPETITWNAVLSTTIHGVVNPVSGTVQSGTTVRTVFKAAKSGRHQHKVTLTVIAVDSNGRQSQPASIDLFVFNC
jgi:hypothetical protein